MTMRVALERLPEDVSLRHAALRDYFCDKDASAERTSEGWDLTLSWPGDPERHIDPALDAGLAWWGGIRRQDMAIARCRTGRLLRSLYDTWTLASWVEWIDRQQDRMATSVVVLHVDDHRDLGSPRLVADDGNWRDLITGDICDLRNPSSVVAAIESGAIGMGSFLTPFLVTLPGIEIRHLCQAPKATHTQDFEIHCSTRPDDLLEPGAPRMVVDLTPIDAGSGPGRYRLTPTIPDWLADIGTGPILLHIDLDYFCNRYDGDSDWESRSNRLDPSPEEIDRQIDEIVRAVGVPEIAERIEDVVVAFSPGFFPAELWRRTDERLTRGLGLDGERTI